MDPWSSEGQRKPVTVLYSDMSGYSTFCEALDPEDVREMMSRVLKMVVDIITRYDGYVHCIIGDEVLAMFGIPRVHEDDPIRAIRAALEIHAAVAGMSDRFSGDLGTPLAMHSGIATGVVVTGEFDPIVGRPGITGETINRAARLTRSATPGEILVETVTMESAAGFFRFEKYRDEDGKHLMDALGAYRVLTFEKDPKKTRRLQGLKASLIARETEMTILQSALAVVASGSGGCIFIEGEAGTGKSRLIAEFKKKQSLQDVEWLQGNAYTYTQSMPFFPIIDILGRFADVRENDSESAIRQKLIEELVPLAGGARNVTSILDRLFALSNDHDVKMNPEAWKLELRQALVKMIDTQSRRRVTVICLEDLHWADPSTVDIVRTVPNEADLPVLFIVTYRPSQSAFAPREITNAFYHRQHIRLADLSMDQGEAMVKSLLRAEQVPRQLMDFIAEHLEGNPFFIEEMINSLVDAGTLRKNAVAWQIHGSIGDTALSANISTIIAARLDQLGETTKRIVQEASVIGKRFSPALLKRISSNPLWIDRSLDILQSLGMIMESDDASERLFAFKHTLVQEVAYNSLLKQQRRDLHEKIARIMEEQTPDLKYARCETLAYHFGSGRSTEKAIGYMVQAGRKGLRKYAVIESHNYYQNAYRLLTESDCLAVDTIRRTLELLLEWFYVFHLLGRYEEVLVLLKRHEPSAVASSDPYLKGMYLTYLGWAFQRREQLARSRDCLLRALIIGEQINNHKVVAYSCACLIWTCTDQGELDQAQVFAAKAEKASRLFESEDPTWRFETDQNLVRFVLTGSAIAHWFRGDCLQCRRLGDQLLEYGENADDVNSISEGHLAHAMGHFAAGNYRDAVGGCITAIDYSTDPLFAINARFLKAYANLGLGNLPQANNELEEIVGFCRSSGYEYIGTSADALASVIRVARGDLSQGIKAIHGHIDQYEKNGKQYHALVFYYMLGRIYLRVIMREEPMQLGLVLRNLPFVFVHLPRAAGYARHYLEAAVDLAHRINATGIKAQALLDLSRFHRARKGEDLSLPLIRESIALFEQLGAEDHLQRARGVLQMWAEETEAPDGQ